MKFYTTNHPNCEVVTDLADALHLPTTKTVTDTNVNFPLKNCYNDCGDIEKKRLPWWSQLVQEDIEQGQRHWGRVIYEWNVEKVYFVVFFDFR